MVLLKRIRVHCRSMRIMTRSSRIVVMGKKMEEEASVVVREGWIVMTETLAGGVAVLEKVAKDSGKDKFAVQNKECR